MTFRRRRLPVTIVAGRWGAGKSQVIDRMIDAVGPRPAVICGDFGHDHGDIETIPSEEELLHATRGCDCCAIRSDLAEVIGDLLDRRTAPSHILVEASGGSDLATISQTFLKDPTLRRHTLIRGIVTVVDGLALGTSIRTTSTTGFDDREHDGLALSDLAVINRLDQLVPAVEQQTVWHLWSQVGSGQLQIDARRGGHDPLPGRILDAPGFDIARQAARLRNRTTDATLDATGERPLRRIRIEQPGELDQTRLDDWIGELQSTLGAGLLRWTARFAVKGQHADWLAQGVRTSTLVDDAPPRRRPATSTIELIGRADPSFDLAEEFERCRA